MVTFQTRKKWLTRSWALFKIGRPREKALGQEADGLDPSDVHVEAAAAGLGGGQQEVGVYVGSGWEAEAESLNSKRTPKWHV